MTRIPFVLFAVVLLAGCRLPERDAALKPLPEGQPFTYIELLARARTTATTALEAFYVDDWPTLVETAASLEQTARFLPKSKAIPASVKDKLGAESEQLRQDAVKLGDAARAKNVKGVNEALQRINLRIRELRVDEKTPAPMPPPKIKP